MLNKSFLIALAATTMLVACSTAPDYKTPDSPVSAEWPQGMSYETLSKDDDGKVSQITWKEFFGSEKLQKVIALTLENNRDLRIAALNVEKAQALYRVQRADLLPTIDAVGNVTRQGIPENASTTGRDMNVSQYNANVGTTAFELDIFGRVRSMNESALEQYLATKEARDAVQISLIAEVVNAYLAYLADRELLILTEDTLNAQKQSYDVIKQSFEMGIGSQLDVSQAATLVETARANKSQYMRRLDQDKNALDLLVGTKLDENLLEENGLETVSIMQDLPVGLSSSVLLNRPDIRQAEHLLKSANADIGVARAAFFPRITLTGSAGLASDSLSDLFKSGSALAWSFIPQATLPIFEGGRNVANLDASQTQEKIAIAQYEKSIQVAFREVSDELAARGTYTNQLNAQKALVEANQTAYNISEARYKHGVDSHLNVIDAQRSLYTAQQEEIVVEQQRLSNLVTLYKVLGGGKL